jgi:hypothetical protein
VVDGIATETQTKVKVFSIANPQKPARNEFEAFMQEHSDIDKALTDLCKKIAKCGIPASKLDVDFHMLFLERMEWATGMQQQSGHKAEFRRVKNASLLSE